MHDVHTVVGEHLFHFYTQSEWAKRWLLWHFGGTTVPTSKEETGFTNPDLSVHIRMEKGQAFRDFNVTIQSDGAWVSFRRADYHLRIHTTYRLAEIDAFDTYALKHALINLYSAFTVERQWGLLLHASCVVQNNHAYVFAGHSGAGKSTIARLSSPRRLLSDEATIVKVSADGISVYDSPFRSDTDPEFLRKPVPVGALHLIHQSEFIDRSKVGMAHGMVQLLDKTFYWAYHAEQNKRLLHMHRLLAEQVPIYNLYFQKNDKFWEAMS